MEILTAENIGFCSGVRRAIDLAVANAPCVTLGALIHNEDVIKKLETEGVTSIDSLDEYSGGTVIIRSHGAGKEVYEQLESKGIPYVDATCPFVKKIHELIARHYAQGYGIVIIGDSNHPETVGHNSWCENTGVIVSCEDDIKLEKGRKYYVVAQTTFDKNLYEKYAEIIENDFKTVVKKNTICYTTISRQTEAERLSKTCDAMLVIGSKSSSNANKLAVICREHCPNTYLITTKTDAASVKAANKFNKPGIIAGASTPDELIREVLLLMSESQEKLVNETGKELSFGELLDSTSSKAMDIKAGKIFKECHVISANEEGIIISFGGKKDGFIDKTEAELDGVEYNPENYKADDVISAMVIEKSNSKKSDERIAFSKKAVEKRTKEIKDSEEMLKGNEFKATIEEATKGGLKAKIGPFTIFVPASQIRMGYVTEADLVKYVGKTLRLRAIKGKKDDAEGELEFRPRKTVIASQRVILEEERAARDEAVWSAFQIGAIVNGKVKRFADFGAFVSVNGFDCLAHISDISHYKIGSPSEVLEIGANYDFVVLKADRENQKVSLGYKQLQKKPYEIASEKYPVGTIVTGTVRGVFPYGAFILIERDVDGLIPVSEIAHNYTQNAADVYKVGDEVTAKVIKFDGNKITLSVKALTPAPEQKIYEEASEEDYQAAKEKRNQRNARRFDASQVGGSSSSRRRSAKKDSDEDEFSSWTSEKSSATFGDLFKGLKLELNDERAEEQSEPVAVAPAEQVAAPVVETPVEQPVETSVDSPVEDKKDDAKAAE